MKYSIIIPNYNSEGFLPRLLGSIPKRADIEVLVIDDESTDGAFQKCASMPEYKDIIFIAAGRKVYAGGARNIGLGRASGEYLLFADSDDLFSKAAFNFFDTAVKGKEEMILFKTEAFVEGTNRVSDRDAYRSYRLTLGDRQAALGAVGPIAKLIRRDFVECNGLFFSEVIAANDIVFSVKAACLAKQIRVVDETAYRISQGEHSLTASISLEKSLSRIKEQRKRIKLVKKYKPVSVFRYCLFYSLLVRFEEQSKQLQSIDFDRELEDYKKELGRVICLLSGIIAKIPYATKLLFTVFHGRVVMLKYLRKLGFSGGGSS